MQITIAALSPTEFPSLTEFREALAAETVQAGAVKLSPEVAAEGRRTGSLRTLSVK